MILLCHISKALGNNSELSIFQWMYERKIQHRESINNSESSWELKKQNQFIVGRNLNFISGSSLEPSKIVKDGFSWDFSPFFEKSLTC